MHYRTNPALSGTQLVQLAKSPAHYQYYIKNPIEPTPAMEFGTAAHTMVLEPETFKDRYAVFSGEGTRASKEYKEFLAQNPNKSILKLNEMDRILDMVTAIENHTLAFELFAVSDNELLNKYGKEKYMYLAGTLRGLDIAQKLLEEQDELQK